MEILNEHCVALAIFGFACMVAGVALTIKREFWDKRK